MRIPDQKDLVYSNPSLLFYVAGDVSTDRSKEKKMLLS
jgi:hypothetical protein